MTAVLRPGSPNEVGMLPERVARARDLCAGWVKGGHTPTLGICVARRGVIVLHEAFGVLGPGPDSAPLDPRALFPVASATKPITATLAMQLVEDGLLGSTRPAKDYLPEISAAGAEEILVHHLLTHTSGFPAHGDPAWVRRIVEKLGKGVAFTPCPATQHPLMNEILTLCWDTPPTCKPGEEMIYSNLNYWFLGEIIRRVSGRAIDDLARERVFAPLGMHDTYYVVPESAAGRVVVRPPEAPGATVPEGRYSLSTNSRELQELPDTAGGAFSTPRDLVIFCQAFLNGGRYGGARILSPASVSAMTRNQIPGIPAQILTLRIPEASYGYGWSITSHTHWKYLRPSLPALGTAAHGGASGVICWLDPVHEIAGAYFEVLMRQSSDSLPLWNADLFMDVVTSAVDE